MGRARKPFGGSGANSSDTTAAEEQDIDPEECPERYAPAEVCLECSMREGCLGGSLCSEGYEGYACSDCAFQFYLLNAKCHPCGVVLIVKASRSQLV